MQVTDASLSPGTQDPSTPRRWTRLAAFWATPTGKIITLATVLAVGLRILTLTQAGYLRGVTEYDDGVYLGATIRLLQGVVPYRDFALVQPPGILLLTTPVAAFAQAFSTVKALALARILTALASAACVPLAGSLVRYRGSVVTLVTCGLLAVYPPDITTAHTLLLEPWMNLFLLLGTAAAFRRGALASPRRLAWAGAAIGFAVSIKFWAALPAAVVLGLCLSRPERRPAALRRFLPGVAAGFLVPVLPFLLSAPDAFWRSTIADQATRASVAVPIAVRFAYVTGTLDLLNSKGQVSLVAGSHSMYAASWAEHVNLSAGVGWLPYTAAALIAAGIAAGYWFQRRRLTQLEVLGLVISVLSSAAILGYSAFYYHYPDFPAPWLAISMGCAAGALAGRPVIRPVLMVALSVLFVVIGGMQYRDTHTSVEPETQNVSHLIPPGACLITDEVSLAIAADRFTDRPPRCPVIIDSLAETLVRGNGVSVYGGADQLPKVVGQWRAWFARADYVWMSPPRYSDHRIPWTPSLLHWFHRHFRPVNSFSPSIGRLYKRDGSPR
ncbi:MAG: hypothetical protein FWE35_14220 [Streptosporangiales bacterium]|nr:hypothetical protein [Streptosporangiales bacterium]